MKPPTEIPDDLSRRTKARDATGWRAVFGRADAEMVAEVDAVVAEEFNTIVSDPLLVDLDVLRTLTSDAVIRRGVSYFREDRVTDLGWDAQGLWAGVEGSQSYQVDVRVDGEPGAAELSFECTCPFEWEPVCKHAVAAMLAYGARQEIPPATLASAEEAAIAERRQRAKTEVSVHHIAGEPWLGTWSAASVKPNGQGRRYRVDIHGLEDRGHHCTCPDFASNRLGTCKHIEAVLHALRGKRRFAPARRRAKLAPALNVVHLGWEADAPRPVVRLRRAAEVAPELEPLLTMAFDARGVLRNDLEILFAFRDRTAGREDVHIAHGAIEMAERELAGLTRTTRETDVARQLRAAGNRMAGLDATLHPYQVEGVAFLVSRGRALLADDMGLGKTLQAIAAATWLRRHAHADRTVIVCPASLKAQWAREIERFTGADTQVVQGNPTLRRQQYAARAVYTILNYELLLRDYDVIQAELAPDLLVLDEAQRIKNWRTRTADAVKRLHTRFAFVLSGTPLENRLEDLYSLMQVVDPHVLGPLWHFLVRFHVTDERGQVLGYRNLSELRSLLAPAMLRRTRAIVADQLSDCTIARIDVKLDRRQRQLEGEALQSAGQLAQILKRRPLTPSEQKALLACLQNARMACDCAALVDKDLPPTSPKLDELGRLLEDLCVGTETKVVVFSQWERMTAFAEDVARSLGIGTARLHGGVPTSRRPALLGRFQDDPACQVLLSTDAGSTGLNLQHASALINLDIPWNPAILDQRIARIHRLGQRSSPHVVLLVSEASYEAYVFSRVEAKRRLFDNVVDADAVEDTVGLTKRDLDTALEALEAASTGTAAATEEPILPEPRAEQSASGDPGAPASKPQDSDISRVVTVLQERLGTRLERVIVRAGALVAVVAAASEGDERLATEVSQDGVPVAILDPTTLAALARVGLLDPTEAITAWQRPVAPPALDAVARRKLAGAAALVEADCPRESIALTAEALRFGLASLAGVSQAPGATELAEWLLRPDVTGAIPPADASLALHAAALAAVPEPPASVAQALIQQARQRLEPGLGAAA